MLEVNIKKNFSTFSLVSEFTLAPGRVLALLGGSGEGKSLTLRCLAGIDKPDSGYIRLNGKMLFDSEQNINLTPQERHIGYLFPQYALFPTMSVRQNILSGLVVKRDLSKETKNRMVDNWLELLQLTEHGHRKPHQLSNGQQQRVALARILINEPDVLLLDEPFSALDTLLKWQLQTEMCKLLQNYAGSTILVSHDINEVKLLTDEVCVIDNGSTEPQISTEELVTNPSTYSACKLNGCRNFSELEYTKQGVLARDWHFLLPNSWQIPKYAQGIALRRRALSPTTEDEALLQGKVVQVIQTPHNTIYQLQTGTSSEVRPLTMELDTGSEPFREGQVVPLKVREQDIFWWHK